MSAHKATNQTFSRRAGALEFVEFVHPLVASRSTVLGVEMKLWQLNYSVLGFFLFTPATRMSSLIDFETGQDSSGVLEHVKDLLFGFNSCEGEVCIRM